MATIIQKKIKRHIYYYYVESGRVNGKPKYVNQKYLGTAETVLAKALAAEKPVGEQVLYSKEEEFGSVALVYDIAARLGIADIIDGILPKRNQGASIGTYILTAAINRAVAPSSMSGLPEWYSGTCLPGIMGIKPSAFTPQNFWNNTCISAKSLERIEEAILKKVFDVYQIDMSRIIYDATNFFTFIDTMQESELAKRGNDKAKRKDLRTVGLALMVSPDSAVPLLHDTYPGNRPDAKEFTVMIERLKERYEAITGKTSDVTIVFDRGNNSEGNIDLLESGKLKCHYIGGLRKSQASELFAVDRGEYAPLDDPSLDGQTAYRAEMDVYGRKATALIIHNPELEEGQLQGIRINIAKTEEQMLTLQRKLMRRASGEVTKGKKPTIESVTEAVGKILKAEYMKDIFRYEILEKDGHIYLSYYSSEENLGRVRIEQLGKKVLFTDRSDYSNEQIVKAYRSAWQVESAFRQMKDAKHLAVQPMFHWTDEKIRVHIFTCVLAYRLCSLLRKELSDIGISMSIDRMLGDTSKIKKIHTLVGELKKPQDLESFTLGNEQADKIMQHYKLKEKYS